MADLVCKIRGCEKLVFGRGWCCAHYTRWLRHNNPLNGVTGNGEPWKFLQETVLKYTRNDCLIWPFGRGSKGYASISESQFNRTGTSCVPRIVCQHLKGPPPTSTHQAAHSCGKGRKGCVSPRHLDWKTVSENHADKIIHGTHQLGERNVQAKLTEKNVVKIRKLKGQMSQEKIAEKFGVSRQSIGDILVGRTWTHG